MQHLVVRVQHLPGWPARVLQLSQQQGGIHHHVPDGGQDVVVQVKLQPMQAVPHGWDLMAPLVVVLAVVFVQLGFDPSGGHQAGLCIGDVPARDQDVHVGWQAAAGDGQVLADVGRAFEQDQRVVHLAKLNGQTMQGPKQVPRSPTRVLQFTGQVAGYSWRQPGRQTSRLHTFRQATQQAQATRQAHHPLPLRQRPRQRELGLAQGPQPVKLSRHGRALVHRSAFRAALAAISTFMVLLLRPHAPPAAAAPSPAQPPRAILSTAASEHRPGRC